MYTRFKKKGKQNKIEKLNLIESKNLRSSLVVKEYLGRFGLDGINDLVIWLFRNNLIRNFMNDFI